MFGLSAQKSIKAWNGFFFIGLAFGLMACENDLETIQKVTETKRWPTEESKEVQLYYSDSGNVMAYLSSPLIQNYEGDSAVVEFPKGLKLLFYKGNKEVESRLEANYAIRKPAEGIMEARDNVKVVNKKGDRLNCEKLTWDERSHKIFSRSFVKIQTKDQIIFGDGFESNEDFSQYKISKIRGTINLNDEQTN
jgi:LPS export ABC transporter protein LptC